jgi:hypothetical protein
LASFEQLVELWQVAHHRREKGELGLPRFKFQPIIFSGASM